MQKVQLVYGFEFCGLEVLYVIRATVVPAEKRTWDYPGCPATVDVDDAELLEVYDENGKLSDEEMDKVRDALNTEFWNIHDGSDRLNDELLLKLSVDEQMACEYAIECKMDQMREERYG